MKRFGFEWNSNKRVVLSVFRETSFISVKTIGDKIPIAITFWSNPNKGIRILSKMGDVSDRIEIGVLSFIEVNGKINDEIIYPWESTNKNFIQIRKLVLNELEFTAESGFELSGKFGTTTVLSGALPHSIAIYGFTDINFSSEPEYPLSRYSFEPL